MKYKKLTMQNHYFQSSNLINRHLLKFCLWKAWAYIVIFIPFYSCFNNHWYFICMLPDNSKYKLSTLRAGKGRREGLLAFLQMSTEAYNTVFKPFYFQACRKRDNALKLILGERLRLQSQHSNIFWAKLTIQNEFKLPSYFASWDFLLISYHKT